MEGKKNKPSGSLVQKCILLSIPEERGIIMLFLKFQAILWKKISSKEVRKLLSAASLFTQSNLLTSITQSY